MAPLVTAGHAFPLLRSNREPRPDREQALLSVIVANPVVSHGPDNNQDHHDKLKGKKDRFHTRPIIINLWFL